MKLLRFSCVVLVVFFVNFGQCQESFLDFQIFRSIRTLLLKTVRSLQDPILAKEMGKVQNEYPPTMPFFCDAKNGPGKRSTTNPSKSIHTLRPGDIDIITAMGDSLTAGNGLLGTNPSQIAVENRGVSWSIGGRKTWRQYMTIPNILKEFNPRLYGYSLLDSYSTERTSKFNVAEGGALISDMPFQAKVLHQRLIHDRRVNMAKHWKLLTIQIGANDICGEICHVNNPGNFIELYEKRMVKTLRFLRDNVPRLMVNIVPTVNVSILLDLKELPQICDFSHKLECPCLRNRDKDAREFYQRLHSEMLKKDEEIYNRDEFNTNEFTVNIQPFSRHASIPTLPNDSTDYRYFSIDCFHFSQRLHGQVAMQLFNNMLEPDSEKTQTLQLPVVLKCPTSERPYLATRQNSRKV